jgi:hypothetical protein
MTTQDIAQLGSYIDSLAPMVAQGRVQWVTLSQMAEIWTTQYGSRPSRYDCAASAATSTPTLTGTPAPTPTPAPSVGGVAESPDVIALPARTDRSPGRSLAPYIAGAAAAIVAAGGLWYTRKRSLR